MYIIIAAFSKEAVSLMAAPDYRSAWVYVPAMVSVIAIKGPLYFYNNFLFYNKNITTFIFITTFIGCIINLVLTFLLIPYCGIFGPILADGISLIVRTFIVIPIIYKEAQGIYSFFRLLIFSVIPIVFITVVFIPSYENLFHNIITEIVFKIVIIFIYAVCVFFLFKNRLSPYFRHIRTD